MERADDDFAPEGQRVENRRSLDPLNQHDQVSLVAEVVALANSGGGRIVVGVTNAGRPVGVDADGVWDQSAIRDLVDGHVEPDRLDLVVGVVELEDGGTVVTIDVPGVEAPPLVMAKDGERADGDTVFTKHQVLVRRNTRVEVATRSDYLRWRDELRARILQQFQMVLDAPESAHLRMVGHDQVRDEPNYFLSRAVDQFRVRPEKLLDADDLLYLFLHRSSIDSSAALVAQLLIHSALRRRATLFFWLALTGVDARQVASILTRALTMSDRDKSDMATAVPMVAALYLTTSEYGELIETMAASSYAHIAAAAREFPTMEVTSEVIDERRRGTSNQRPLIEVPDDRLLDQATALVREQNAGRIARRLPNLGLEYLARRLDRPLGHR